MAKTCSACGGAVCEICGGCVAHGECSCVEDQIAKLKNDICHWRVRAEQAENALKQIAKISRLEAKANTAPA